MQCTWAPLCAVVHQHSKALMFCSCGLGAMHDDLTTIMLMKTSLTPMRLTGFLEREKNDYESSHWESQIFPITTNKTKQDPKREPV